MIWDEAILPGLPHTLQRDGLANLLQPIRRIYPDLVANIEDLLNEIKDMSVRERVSVPDLEPIHDVDLNGVLKLFSDAPQGHQKAVYTLWLLESSKDRLPECKSERLITVAIESIEDAYIAAGLGGVSVITTFANASHNLVPYSRENIRSLE